MNSTSKEELCQTVSTNSILNDLKNQNLKDLLVLLEEQLARKELLLAKELELKTSSKKEVKAVSTDLHYKVSKCLEQFSQLKKKLNEESNEKLPSKLENPDIYLQLDQLSVLEKSKEYLRVFDYIRTSSEKIKHFLESGLNSSALDIFSNLQLIQQVHFKETQCWNHVSYCTNTVSHWEKELIKRLSKDFETSLEELNWPLSIIQSNPSVEQISKFNEAATSIIRLSSLLSNSNNSKNNKMSTILADFQDPILPIMIMVKPLRKRFRFNFFGSNTTSKETKPEWYFSQVKNWIRDLVPFLTNYLEPLTLTLMDLSCTVEFIRALSELLIIKADVQLNMCLENTDNVTFAKILEESIIYENEVGQVLRESYSNKNFIPPFVSTLFSQPHILKHWLIIEKNACQEKLDQIFSSTSAWDQAVIPGPPEIVHLFIALLRFITDRFSHLSQPGQRIQFLQLLVDIIDDFRYRCLQIWKSRIEVVNDFTSNILFDYIMADALWHIQLTLDSWEDLPLFESLSFFLDNIQDIEEKQLRTASSSNSKTTIEDTGYLKTESIFDQFEDYDETRKQAIIGAPNQGLFSNVKDLYECLSEEILCNWSKNVMREIEESVFNYTEKKWHSLPDDRSESTKLEVSPEFLIPLQKLSSLCKTVENGMTSALAEKWIKRLAVNIDDMLMDNLITQAKFSKGAVQQLKHDFTEGLFPVFAEYDIDISLFLTGITCALKIWEMPVGDAMLIFDDVTDANNSYNHQEELLAEIDITLNPPEVLRLLKTRTDIIC